MLLEDDKISLFNEKYAEFEQICKKETSQRNKFSDTEIWGKYKVKLREFSLYLIFYKNMKIINVANKLGYSRRTLGQWIWNYNKMGAIGLIDKVRKGRPKKINGNTINKIKKIIDLNPTKYSTGKSLANLIKENFNINISIRHCQRLKQNDLK